MLWGVLFLGESCTAAMVAGCAVILAGTFLATGAGESLLAKRTAARPA